ncbi:MAG: response regulator [Candidatus Limnocylindria bacterium]
MSSNDDQTDPAIARRQDGGRAPALFVVDDDVATLELLCEIGRDAGWVARGFTRLSELRSSLDETKPTLLILDDDLPDGRGGDLARDLREDDRMADVPLLVCTAAHPMRQAEIGAWAPVVSKPFDLAEIDGFLRAAAARHNGSDSFGQRAG